ncbi:MAG: 16S rRNA (guanine(527)-N(7))-methyltransferase RsmG [Bacteroidia bacterium]|nr:16S rRNA (guanine(527)-N(7))-methyltransferase RsmG [Bacteroidia bacterium]
MNTLSLSEIDLIRYFPAISDYQQELLVQFAQEIIFWNSQINLISRNDISHLWERHLFHSLAIHHFATFEDGTTAIDVGTGGGFPGIPLAIMNPNVHFTLLDSIGKKINTLTKIAASLKLDNVTTIQERIENHNLKYDYVVGRAVTDLNLFYADVKHCIARRSDKKVSGAGIWYLRGPDIVSPKKIAAKIFPLNQLYPQIFFETKLLVYIPTYI